jgi:hypothetical protein
LAAPPSLASFRGCADLLELVQGVLELRHPRAVDGSVLLLLLLLGRLRFLAILLLLLVLRRLGGDTRGAFLLCRALLLVLAPHRVPGSQPR